MRSEESEAQKAFITWVRYSEGTYPELKYLFAVPNGGKRSIITATRMKAEGALAGVLDLHLPVAKGKYIGLWIEMKSRRGKLSAAQLEFGQAMERFGHLVRVCRNWEAAKDITQWYVTQT